MDYSTPAKLQSFLGLGSNDDVSIIMTNATALLDSSLGENFGERTKTRRIDGSGTCRVVMENKVQSVTLIRDARSGRNLTLDFIDGRVVYTKEIMDCGMKNIEITYKLGYTEVPKDLETYFLEYCKVLYQRSKVVDPNKVVTSKKIDDLSITFLSPTELIAQGEAVLLRPDMQAILKKYRNFSFS